MLMPLEPLARFQFLPAKMGASKALLMAATMGNYVSTHPTTASNLRPLICVSSYHHSAARLVPHPPDLIRWVQREGGFVHPDLKVSNKGSYGIGLVASREIGKGSELISLPNHIPLRFPSADSDGGGSNSVLAHLGNRVPEELWAMRLGLKLLQERATVGSFWWPYVSNLPEAFNVPIFFSGEDIKSLQYAPLIHQVHKRCRFLLEFEKEIRKFLEILEPKDHPFGGQDVNASSLGWAMSAVSSRAFRLHGTHSSTRIQMMLPLIDMCNHSFHPNGQIVQMGDASNPNMSIKVIAEKEIKQDNSVTLNYGNLSNDFFLLDYGFVIPSNPYDCVELKYDGVLLDAASMAAGVSSACCSSPAIWQQELLSWINLYGDAADLKVTLGGPELMDGRLLAALRVLLTSDMELVQKNDLETLMSLSSQAPLGVPNEISVLRTAIALCVISLGHFPTKIMEDESLLKEEISIARKLAIDFRIEKKSMIIDVMKNLTKRVKLLESKERTAV